MSDVATPHQRQQQPAALPVVRVGGVPEHFNLPWQLADFERHGVRVEFVECGLGTGDMVRRCRAGDLDMVVALTEGLVADTAGRGGPLRLLATYAESPLCWAVSTAGGATGAPRAMADLARPGTTFGVSRLLSGSHLMAAVLAHERDWPRPTFAVLGGFEALRQGVRDGRADAFLWETFTTKPFHDAGDLRRLGEVSTRWPAFSVAARADTAARRRPELAAALAAVREACAAFGREDPAATARMVASRYGLREADASAWLASTRLSCAPLVSEAALREVLDALARVGAVPFGYADEPGGVGRLVLEGFAELVRGRDGARGKG